MKVLSEMLSTLQFLVLLWLGGGLCAPAPSARALQQSPGDLDLVKEDSRQPSPPRRITTKSLFVLPNRGPESLPACAEGYRPDAMARCVKVVKVDETAHLEFLLQKLNQQFAPQSGEITDEFYDYGTPEESFDVDNGPHKIVIPLALQMKGSRPDGEVSSVSKKDAAPKPIATSSPEVAPEYAGNKNQFFPDAPPAAEVDAHKNLPNAEEPISILPVNSTNSGVTILVSTNGNFENMTSSNKDEGSIDFEKELTDVKALVDKKSNKEMLTESSLGETETTTLSLDMTTLESSDDTETDVPLLSSEVIEKKTDIFKTKENEKQNENTNIKPVFDNPVTSSPSLIKVSGQSANAEKDNDETNIPSTSDILIDEIESLKISKNQEKEKNDEMSKNDPSKVKESLLVETDATKLTSDKNPECLTCHKRSSLNTAENKPTLKDVHFDLEKEVIEGSESKLNDIETKIKILSSLADISRNTDDSEKSTLRNQIRFPGPMTTNRRDIPGRFKNQPSGSTIRFPSNLESKPPNIVTNVRNAYEKEIQRGNQYAENRPKPAFWWPSNDWNDRPNNPPDLVDFWSRMPLVSEYPYNVRMEHDSHVPHYGGLYSSPHRRLNLRHTAENHRKGRIGNHRKRQTQPEQFAEYKRARHPHFREIGEVDESLVRLAFKGR